MYKNFFGLHENLFNVNPDPRFLFMTRHTEEALACLTCRAARGLRLLLRQGRVAEAQNSGSTAGQLGPFRHSW